MGGSDELNRAAMGPCQPIDQYQATDQGIVGATLKSEGVGRSGRGNELECSATEGPAHSPTRSVVNHGEGGVGISDFVDEGHSDGGGLECGATAAPAHSPARGAGGRGDGGQPDLMGDEAMATVGAIAMPRGAGSGGGLECGTTAAPVRGPARSAEDRSVRGLPDLVDDEGGGYVLECAAMTEQAHSVGVTREDLAVVLTGVSNPPEGHDAMQRLHGRINAVGALVDAGSGGGLECGTTAAPVRGPARSAEDRSVRGLPDLVDDEGGGYVLECAAMTEQAHSVGVTREDLAVVLTGVSNPPEGHDAMQRLHGRINAVGAFVDDTALLGATEAAKALAAEVVTELEPVATARATVGATGCGARRRAPVCGHGRAGA